MENKHWNKPYSKRAYDLIQGNIDKVNHTNNLYEKQENNMAYYIYDFNQVRLFDTGFETYLQAFDFCLDKFTDEEMKDITITLMRRN